MANHPLADVFIRARPDTTGFKEELTAKVDAETKNVNAKVKINLDPTSDLSRQGKLIVNSIAASLTAGSPILGAALVGGLGLTGIGVGIAAALRDPTTKAAVVGLGTSIKNELVGAAKPFQKAIQDSVPLLRQSLSAISPQLQTIFSSLAPALTALSGGFGKAIENAMPGIAAASRVASEALTTLAGLLPGLGDSFGEFFQMLSHHSDDIKAGLVFTVHLLEAGLGALTDIIGGLMAVFGPLLNLFSENTTTIRVLLDVVLGLLVAYKTFAVVTSVVEFAQKGLKTVLDLTTQAFVEQGVAAKAAAAAEGTSGAAVAGTSKYAGLAGALRGLGPVAIGIGAAFFLWNAHTKDVAKSTDTARASTEAYTQVLRENNGVVNQAVEKAALLALTNQKNSDSHKNAVELGKLVGVSQEELTKAYIQGGDALEGIVKKQELYIAAEQKAATTDVENSTAHLKNIKNARELIAILEFLVPTLNNEATAVTKTGAAFGDAWTQAEKYKAALVEVGPVVAAVGGNAELMAAKVAGGASLLDQFKEALHFKEAVSQFKEHQQGLAKAVTDASNAVKDAQDRVRESERTLADDQVRVKEAQEGLTKARLDAAEALKELHKQQRDAPDNIEAARIRLAQAELQEIASRGVDPNSLQRRQILLDLKNAREDLTDTQADSVKINKEVAEADKKGIEGAPGVVTAKKNVSDAENQVITDRKNLAKANDDVTTAEKNLSKAKEASSKTFDINTIAGQNNAEALLQVWDAHNLLNPAMSTSYEEFVDLSRQMGLSKTDAEKLATALGLVAIPRTSELTVEAQLDLGKLGFKGLDVAAINKELRNQQGIGGGGLARGGLLDGPGTETSDSIPLWGSKGEFMQNAAAVKHYGVDFMKDLNARKIPKLATGGSIDEIIAAAKRSGFLLGQLTTDPQGYHGSPHADNGGYHSSHRAVDFGNAPGGGGKDGDGMAAWFMSHYGSKLLEEIHSSQPGPPYKGWYIKNGTVVSPYGPASAHYNHVHIAANPGFSSGVARGPGDFSGGPGNFAALDKTTLPSSVLLLRLMAAHIARDVATNSVLGLFGAKYPITTDFSKSLPPGLIGSGANALGSRAIAALAESTARSAGASNKQLLALMETGLVESGMKNYANRNVPSSLKLPHDAVGSDHTSVGFLQQQVGVSGKGAGWGSVSEAMNVAHATKAFINAAKSKDKPFYSSGELAQKVQVSAFPSRYNQRREDARALLNLEAPGIPASVMDTGGVLRPGHAGVNLSNDNEFVYTKEQLNGMSRTDKLELAALIAQALRNGPDINVKMDGEVVARRSEASVADLLGGAF